jgi:RHS repeat-associated protein
MLPAAKEETFASLGSAEGIFSLAAGAGLLRTRDRGKAETLFKTRVWGFGEKIRPCIGATWQLSGNPRWGCEKSSWETVVGSALDANGNTLSDPSGKSYSWDFENRLVSATVPGTGTVTFKYDPFGRRIYKSSPTWTGAFAYDGNNLIETMNSSGTVVARYTQGPTIDQPLAEFRGSTTDYYEADALGSVTSLSNGTGTLANTYTYDSFGNVTNSTGSLSNPFRYAGREFDSETSLYFNRARYYDQSSGRFVSEDPSEFVGGRNFYSYVGNDPTNLTDPLGLTDCVVTPTAVVCTNWGPGLNWMTPQEPQPPQLPSDLTPNPPPPPPAPPCSCNNWLANEGEEIDRRSWQKVKNFGFGFGGEQAAEAAAEYYELHTLGKLLPVIGWAHYGELMYDLWEIQEEVSAKYEHCH